MIHMRQAIEIYSPWTQDDDGSNIDTQLTAAVIVHWERKALMAKQRLYYKILTQVGNSNNMITKAQLNGKKGKHHVSSHGLS